MLSAYDESTNAELAFLRWVKNQLVTSDGGSRRYLDEAFRAVRETNETWFYQETAEAIGQMWPRALLRWLAALGWEKRRSIDGDQVKLLRIWETQGFQRLSFAEDSEFVISWFRERFQRTIEYKQQGHREDSKRTKPAKTIGIPASLFLLQMERWESSQEIEEMASLFGILGLLNPTCSQNASDSEAAKEAIKLEWAMPWLGRYIAEKWKANVMLTDAKGIGGLREITDVLTTTARRTRRYGILAPVMSYLKELTGREPFDVEEESQALEKSIQGKHEGLRLNEIQERLEAVAAVLDSVEGIEECHQDAVRVYRVDRTVEHRWMLAHWREMEFEKTLPRVRAWVKRLRNVIG